MTTAQDDLYEQIAAEYAAPLARLACAYELNREARADLLQEIHIALWRSLPSFGQRCSLRTWVYRVAHNTAATHVLRHRRRARFLAVDYEAIDGVLDPLDMERSVDESRALEQLTTIMQQFAPPDRELIVLYLEGLPLTDIADITGLSAANSATRIHRLKKLITRHFHARKS